MLNTVSNPQCLQFGGKGTTSDSQNISKITNTLYISDAETSQNSALMENLQIRHIVTVGSELQSPKHPFCSYLHIPVKDSRHEPLKDFFDKCNKFISEAQAKKQCVLVHCAVGRSRSATIVIAYLMNKYQISYQEAYNFVRRKRSNISPNQGFIHQLKIYQKEIMALKNS